MSTRALDVVTIMHALRTLEGELDISRWSTTNDSQDKLFAWLYSHREQLSEVTGLDAKASRFYEELNAYLVEHRFDPMFDPFDPDNGIGVVSILDKLVNWLHGPYEIVKIRTEQGMLPGFDVPPDGVNIYEVEGYQGSYLLELLTKSDDTPWLFIHDDTTLTGLDLVTLSMDVMGKNRQKPTREWYGDVQPTFAGAQVLMLDFKDEPDLGWLMGASATTPGDTWTVTQAKQEFKMRMDQTGARVKVATGIGMTRTSVSLKPMKFIVDRPFYGWWTQKDLSLPMAAFFADWDALRQPEGSLEDL